MAGWHHRVNGHEFGWTPGVGDGQGGLACCDSWGCKESDTTERLNWQPLSKFLFLLSPNLSLFNIHATAMICTEKTQVKSYLWALKEFLGCVCVCVCVYVPDHFTACVNGNTGEDSLPGGMQTWFHYYAPLGPSLSCCVMLGLLRIQKHVLNLLSHLWVLTTRYPLFFCVICHFKMILFSGFLPSSIFTPLFLCRISFWMICFLLIQFTVQTTQ